MYGCAKRVWLAAAVAACAAATLRTGADELHFEVIDPPVLAQHDITVRAPTSNHPQDPRPLPLECSGMAYVDGRLLLTSDRHDHVVFTATIDSRRAAVNLPEAATIIRNEKWLLSDLEAVAVHRRDQRTRAYLFTSWSNDPDGQPAPNRRRLARAQIGPDGRIDSASVVVLSAEPLRAALMEQLAALRVPEYVAYTMSRSMNTPRGVNIEGAAWTPRGDVLLAGLRNPLAGEDALVMAVAGVDEAFDQGDPSLLQLSDLFRLNLGGRGVADLAWDPLTRGYLIAAAKSNGPRLSEQQPYPLTDLDSALFWWSGHKNESPIPIARVRDLNVEAITRVGDTDLIAIGSDEGDVSEGRVARQSVVMLVHFTGVTAGERRVAP